MDFKSITTLIMVLSLNLSNVYAAPSTAIVCDQAYALCTSAPCVPDPKDPSKSICDCAVQQGKSAGFTACEKRKPYVDDYQATHLISTFSFEQFDNVKSMACPKGKPWSNCVDMPCTVDPQNSQHAICSCQLSVSEAFFTFGGKCETNTCGTGFWSGAVPGAASDALRNALSAEVTSSNIPMSCPVKSAN